MAPLTNFLAVIEIDERPASEARTRELTDMFEGFEPFVTATPRGRLAVRLHIEADSLPQAALRSVAAVTQATHADAVALAVMPEVDVLTRTDDSRFSWGLDPTWLDDFWMETRV